MHTVLHSVTTRETYARKSLPFAGFSCFRLAVSGARNAALATYLPLHIIPACLYDYAPKKRITRGFIFIKASLFSYKLLGILNFYPTVYYACIMIYNDVYDAIEYYVINDVKINFLDIDTCMCLWR